MEHGPTAWIAIYGAVLSTVGVCWQIFQWLRSHPRIDIRAEADGNGMDEFIRFEIRNRGGKATTIEEIMFTSYPNWLLRVFKFPNSVEYLSAHYRDTIKLPVLLQPGELWRGTCPIENERTHFDDGKSKKERLEAGKLYFRLRCAHTDRLISGVVKPEGFFPRM